MFQPDNIDVVKHGGAAFRTFLNLAQLWELSLQEQADLLSIDYGTFEDFKSRISARENVEVPLDVLTRLGSIISIYASLGHLLSIDRSAGWLRSPNSAHPFNGRSALDLMTTGDLSNLDGVAKYLLGQIHGG